MSGSAGLVLTGGGARAAYQVGALQALSEILPAPSIPFRVLSGTSAGAINSAYLASHAHDWASAAGGLKELWNKLELKSIYRTDSLSLSQISMGWISRTLFGGGAGTRKTANFLLSTEPLRELLSREVDFGMIKRNIADGILQGLSFSAVHYMVGTTISFFDAAPGLEAWVRSNRMGMRVDLSVAHIMASAAIPVFFPPVEIESQFFGDGSLRETTPLSPAIHLGADRILAISIQHKCDTDECKESMNQKRTSPSLAEITGELMNSLFLDSLDSDVERMYRINENIAQIRKLGSAPSSGPLREIPVMLLRPSRDLGEVIPPMLLKRFPVALRYLFKGLGASNNQGNSLVSYLAFLQECIAPILELGHQDTLAKRDEILRFMNE